MANLKRNDLLAIIKKRTQQVQIDRAKALESDIKFYVVGDENQTIGKESFEDWLQGQIAKEKQKEFRDVMTYPLPTATLSEIILNDLSKVLESYNKNIKAIRFKPESGTTGKDFENNFKISEIMSNEVYPTFRTAPNSLIVIEPTEGPGKKPDLYFVPVHKFIHVEQSIKGEVEYAVWGTNDANTTLAACDSEKFYFIDIKEGIDNAKVKPVPHTFGITPARFIYPVFSDTEDRIKVNSPLANQVGQLRWFLFFSLAKRVLDKSAPFPIYSHYAMPCSYTEHGIKCDGGFINKVHVDDEGEESVFSHPCPACSDQKNKLIAGSRVEIRAPREKDDVDLRNPVQVLSAEEVSITFAVKEQERLEQAIYYNTVGKSLVPLESFSASVDQIDVAQESRKNTLMKMKLVFEETHNFIVRCFAKAIYGNTFVGSDVDYGDNWFLRTTAQELETYKTLKDNTVPVFMLTEQLKNIAKRQYSTSPDERDRQLLLIDLEPFVTETVSTVKEWFDSGIVDKDTLVFKTYFNKIVNDAESTFGNLGTYLNSTYGKTREKRNSIIKYVELQVKKYSNKVTITKPTEENGGTKPKTESTQSKK